MPNIRILSDLHFEFEAPDDTATFIEELRLNETPACILAGDIATMHTMDRVGLLAARWPGTEFYWVAGNHEYYQSNFPVIDADMERVANAHPNLHVLNRRRRGRIIGASLWYPPVDLSRWMSWSDQYYIHDAYMIFYRAGQDAEFLQTNVTPSDIVVTHMLPHPDCIAPRWQRSSENIFFLHDQSALIQERAPRLWVFGHTHETVDVKVGKTRLVCNPRGYVKLDPNPNFDPYFEISLA